MKTVGIWYLDKYRVGMVEKRWVFKWSRFQIGSEIWKPNYLRSGQMAPVLWKAIGNSKKMSGFGMVWFSNGWDYSCSPNICKIDHLKSNPQKFRISNGPISDTHCNGNIQTMEFLVSDFQKVKKHDASKILSTIWKLVHPRSRLIWNPDFFAPGIWRIFWSCD